MQRGFCHRVPREMPRVLHAATFGRTNTLSNGFPDDCSNRTDRCANIGAHHVAASNCRAIYSAIRHTNRSADCCTVGCAYGYSDNGKSHGISDGSPHECTDQSV